MSDHRRNIKEAIEHNPRVDAFIHEGVVKKPRNSKPIREVSNKDTSNAKPQPIQSPKTQMLKGDRKKKQSKALDDRLAKAAMSKATIQKTVRFNPQLIARWEQLAQASRENGETPKSFQQVQNEALQLWLEKKQCQDT